MSKKPEVDYSTPEESTLTFAAVLFAMLFLVVGIGAIFYFSTPWNFIAPAVYIPGAVYLFVFASKRVG